MILLPRHFAYREIHVFKSNETFLFGDCHFFGNEYGAFRAPVYRVDFDPPHALRVRAEEGKRGNGGEDAHRLFSERKRVSAIRKPLPLYRCIPANDFHFVSVPVLPSHTKEIANAVGGGDKKQKRKGKHQPDGRTLYKVPVSVFRFHAEKGIRRR